MILTMTSCNSLMLNKKLDSDTHSLPTQGLFVFNDFCSHNSPVFTQGTMGQWLTYNKYCLSSCILDCFSLSYRKENIMTRICT